VFLLFAAGCDIISKWSTVIFGLFFALIGQAGELKRSMMKHNAELKEPPNKLPVFGGILDIIDSGLFSGAFAYLFLCSPPPDRGRLWK
jgi:phosphatidate cytidylyltransferase